MLKTFYAELGIAEGEAVVLGNDMRTIKRKHIPQLRRKLGIVFQDFQLLTDRSVYDNLEFVLRATGWKTNKRLKTASRRFFSQGRSNKGYKLPNELPVVSNSVSLSRGLHDPAPNHGAGGRRNLRGISRETGKAIVELSFTASAGKGLQV